MGTLLHPVLQTLLYKFGRRWTRDELKTVTKNGARGGFRYFDLCNEFLRLLVGIEVNARKGRGEGTKNGRIRLLFKWTRLANLYCLHYFEILSILLDKANRLNLVEQLAEGLAAAVKDDKMLFPHGLTTATTNPPCTDN